MQSDEIIGILKNYVNQTLIGMGALKGASCQITEFKDEGSSYEITFSWKDNEGTTHTKKAVIHDGIDKVSEMSDINLADLTDGDILYWNATQEKWVNIPAGAVTETEYSAIQSLLS